MSYALCCGHETVFRKLPWIGLRIETAFEHIFLIPARWLAVHYLHLTGAAAVIHPSAFADRALDWIAAGLMLTLALVVTLAWSLIDELPKPRRLAYPLLFEILRWILRITLVISILWYGAIKIFPIQMDSPSLAVLNERVGDTSPMTMLWTVLGMNPAYERLCGAVETLCALLLLFRRTALAGAVLAIVVLTNIVLFDIFFDVAVRLYAFGLLAMALTLIVPDAQALLRFFFTRSPATPTTTWGLPDAPRSLRAAALLFEVCLFLSAFKPIFSQEHRQSQRELANEQHPAAVAGQWHIDSSSPAADPLRGGNGELITDIFLEPSGRLNLRSTDRRLWGGGTYDAASHKLAAVAGMRGVPYTFTQPEPNHLILTPASTSSNDPTLQLTRVPLPADYPLLQRIHDRSLHLVEEWGFLR